MSKNVDNILAAYDEEIDALAADAEGYHDTIDAMRRDVHTERAGLSQQQVSQMAQQMDIDADEEESLPYDPEDYGVGSDEDPSPRRQTRRGSVVNVSVIVPPCRRKSYVEVIHNRTIFTSCAIPPSDRSRKITLRVPVGKNIFRIVRKLSVRKVNVSEPGTLDLRR